MTPDPATLQLRPSPALVAALLLTLSACAGRSGPAGAPSDAPATAASGPDRAGLHPGDALLLRVWREPGMSDTLRVDEDGRVTFPLLGARTVTGIPTDSLKRRVIADYGQYVKSEVEVTVLRRLSVLGAVKQPGLYAVDPTYSLADVLARAGGTTTIADKQDIRLVRGGEVVRHSLEETRTVASLPVRSGDQVVVGERSWLSRNWQWLAGTMVSASVLILTR
jgi:polysaccharide export outer membrane protein